mgnify:CR=1 FL=1
MVTAGYSGTPLAKKLGIKEGTRMLLLAAPRDYRSLVQPLPAAVSFAGRASHDVDLVHLFATRKRDLQKHLASLRKTLRPDASIWVSWPKKVSKKTAPVPTDITEDTIRDVALPLGFVDIKVCAVSDVWSGLKVVVRKELRTSTPPERKPVKRAEGQRTTKLPASMVSGKASPARAAAGDQPVFAYIASLPQPQRGIAERVDALAAKTLPGLQRSVKWGMAYYGVGDGWHFSCGGFDTHVKLMFINGVALTPVPPVTPVAMGKATRGVELTSVAELDERQVAAWMTQVTAMPGVGRKKR